MRKVKLRQEKEVKWHILYKTIRKLFILNLMELMLKNLCLGSIKMAQKLLK